MIETRLTEQFELTCPIIQAPMAIAAGGELAAAVSQFGGLGLIGGGYGDREWIDTQFALAQDTDIGCGLISWSLSERPEILSHVLEKSPKAIFLSFGDPAEFIKEISEQNIPLICQIQTLKDAEHAIDVGVDVLVAQGAEAGGHGESRATITLVPEVADLIASRNPNMLLCAAGGIGDGRGLAAALMLGADGVVVGSRFWASAEALVHKNMLKSAVESTGDETIRTSVMDLARHLEWPSRYTARVLKNDFTDQWHDNLDGLKLNAEQEAKRWKAAWQAGDTSTANTFVGEVTGLIHEIQPAKKILSDIVDEAKLLLERKWT